MATTFTWLHLSDLHVGQTESKRLWPRVKDKFFKDLDHCLKANKIAQLDMVLFTGDLTQRGTKDEFAGFESFVAELGEHFPANKPSPHFIAVPGNHDLVRPDSNNAALLTLVHLWKLEEVHRKFWDKGHKSIQRELVEGAFQNYKCWWDKIHKLSSQSYMEGILPGDFSVTIEKDNIKLGIVGLNSAFLHLMDGMQDKLVVSLEQFEAACGGDAAAWAKPHHAALLLTHHPVTWLSPASQQTFDTEIHCPDRFAFHLFGHMHEPQIESKAYGAGMPRNRFQGSSLFGLEQWGEGKKVERIHGYSLYQFKINESSAYWRVLPRRGERDQNQVFSFRPDWRFTLEAGSEWTEWIPIGLPHHRSRILATNSRPVAAFVGARNFGEVHEKVKSLLKAMQQSGRTTEVLNIALDMGYTWNLIQDDVLNIKWEHTVKWRSLMVDPSWLSIQESNSLESMVQLSIAQGRIDQIQKFCEENKQAFESRNIQFECRAYGCEPVMHGFLLDNKQLYVGFHFSASLSPLPYLEFSATDDNGLDADVSSQFTAVFRIWFDQQWKNARAIWPLESASNTQ